MGVCGSSDKNNQKNIVKNDNKPDKKHKEKEAYPTILKKEKNNSKDFEEEKSLINHKKVKKSNSFDQSISYKSHKNSQTDILKDSDIKVSFNLRTKTGKKKYSSNDIIYNSNLSENNENNIDLSNSYDSEPKKENFLMCPECQNRIPHLKNVFYDINDNEIKAEYRCVCFQNKKKRFTKEISLNLMMTAIQPSNPCPKHLSNHLTLYCKTCKEDICINCKKEFHSEHIMKNPCKITREEIKKMNTILDKKEEEFEGEIEISRKKLEKGIEEIIRKLYQLKDIYHKQFEKIKNKHEKIFNMLKTLYYNYKHNINELNVNENDALMSNQIKYFSMKLPEEKEKEKKKEDKEKEKKEKEKNENPDSNRSKKTGKIEEKSETNETENPPPIYQCNIQEILSNLPNNEIPVEVKFNFDFSKSSPFSMEPLKCLNTIEAHNDKIVTLIELSNKNIATGSYDNTIKIWNHENFTCEKTIAENGYVLTLLEFIPNFLLSGTSENDIQLWDLQSLANISLHHFKDHLLWINCLVKCDNKYFASGSNDSTIKIWDFNERKLESTLKGHNDCILTVIILKNENLCSGSADMSIKIWDWRKCECILAMKGHKKWVKCVYQLNNNDIISGSDDMTIKVWRDDKIYKTLKGHRHSVRTLCQIDNNKFVSGGFDNDIRIWDIKNYKCIQTVKAHKSNVICIVVLKNGKFCSCSNDHTIKIWSL